VEIFTIGFTKSSARDFFGKLTDAGIQRLIDVRLRNTSQLASFAKRDDLEFFLEALCGIRYVHEPLLAPTQNLLDAYKKQKGDWRAYAQAFIELIQSRRIEQELNPEDFRRERSVLLCSEDTPEHCHRRLVVEYLQSHWPDVQPVHL
jgi:uncharacterized protein (DUF488 family)